MFKNQINKVEYFYKSEIKCSFYLLIMSTKQKTTLKSLNIKPVKKNNNKSCFNIS